MTRVKICGIKKKEDALVCAAAGADAIGLVFTVSPRRVQVQEAIDICMGLPPFISRVGVFVDEKSDTVQQIARLCGLTALQFHGSEDSAYCRSFSLPVIKAVRVRTAADLAVLGQFPADCFVLDTFDPDLQGGTGRSFDWSMLTALPDVPIILAGGLNAGNVADAICLVRPYGVDVSGGVEKDGEKDKEMIDAFISAARRFEAATN